MLAVSAASILDDYLAARDALRELIRSHDHPFCIDDCRGLRWGIAAERRRNDETRSVLYIECDGAWRREFCQYGHVANDADDDVSWVRETNPQEDTLYVLTTSLRDDAAAEAAYSARSK